MSKSVVDGFELVEIQENQRERNFLPRTEIQAMLREQHKASSIRNIGELIGNGKLKN